MTALVAAAGCGEDPDVQVVLLPDGKPAILVDDGISTGSEEAFVPDDAASPGVCLGNNDGRIDAAEMPVVLGAAASYLANAQGQDVAVKVTGEQVGEDYVWDFTSGPAAVHKALVVLDPADFWFADEFPGADYATQVSVWDDDVLGVFAVEPDRVLMLGLASKTRPDQPGHTLLKYDGPLEVYRFPLEVGASWSQTVTFKDAVIKGVQNAGQEEYSFLVDGRGGMLLPDFTLKNVLRVRLELTQTFVVSRGKPDISHLQLFFVHECLGEVARIVSLADETELDFTTATEFRRLGL